MSTSSVASTHAELFQALGPLATALAEAVKQTICRAGVSHVHDQPYDHALGSALEQSAVLTLVSHLRAATPESQHLRDVLAELLQLPARAAAPAPTPASDEAQAEPPTVPEGVAAASDTVELADDPVWECELCPEPLPEPELPPVPVDPNELLGLAAVAQLLDMSVPYVRMLCQVGKLDVSAGDDGWYVRRFVVEAYKAAVADRQAQRAARRRPALPVKATAVVPEVAPEA